MKKIILLFTAFTLTSCIGRGEPKESVQKGDFTVEFLFEQNGCKMYRFKDGLRYIYWSDCRGKVQSYYTTSSGKTTYNHYEESITTEQP